MPNQNNRSPSASSVKSAQTRSESSKKDTLAQVDDWASVQLDDEMDFSAPLVFEDAGDGGLGEEYSNSARDDHGRDQPYRHDLDNRDSYDQRERHDTRDVRDRDPRDINSGRDAYAHDPAGRDSRDRDPRYGRDVRSSPKRDSYETRDPREAEMDRRGREEYDQSLPVELQPDYMKERALIAEQRRREQEKYEEERQLRAKSKLLELERKIQERDRQSQPSPPHHDRSHSPLSSNRPVAQPSPPHYRQPQSPPRVRMMPMMGRAPGPLPADGRKIQIREPTEGRIVDGLWVDDSDYSRQQRREANRRRREPEYDRRRMAPEQTQPAERRSSQTRASSEGRHLKILSRPPSQAKPKESSSETSAPSPAPPVKPTDAARPAVSIEKPEVDHVEEVPKSPTQGTIIDVGEPRKDDEDKKDDGASKKVLKSKDPLLLQKPVDAVERDSSNEIQAKLPSGKESKSSLMKTKPKIVIIYKRAPLGRSDDPKQPEKPSKREASQKASPPRIRVIYKRRKTGPTTSTTSSERVVKSKETTEPARANDVVSSNVYDHIRAEPFALEESDDVSSDDSETESENELKDYSAGVVAISTQQGIDQTDSGEFTVVPSKKKRREAAAKKAKDASRREKTGRAVPPARVDPSHKYRPEKQSQPKLVVPPPPEKLASATAPSNAEPSVRDENKEVVLASSKITVPAPPVVNPWKKVAESVSVPPDATREKQDTVPASAPVSPATISEEQLPPAQPAPTPVSQPTRVLTVPYNPIPNTDQKSSSSSEALPQASAANPAEDYSAYLASQLVFDGQYNMSPNKPPAHTQFTYPFIRPQETAEESLSPLSSNDAVIEQQGRGAPIAPIAPESLAVGSRPVTAVEGVPEAQDTVRPSSDDPETGPETEEGTQHELPHRTSSMPSGPRPSGPHSSQGSISPQNMSPQSMSPHGSMSGMHPQGQMVYPNMPAGDSSLAARAWQQGVMDPTTGFYPGYANLFANPLGQPSPMFINPYANPFASMPQMAYGLGFGGAFVPTSPTNSGNMGGAMKTGPDANAYMMSSARGHEGPKKETATTPPESRSPSRGPNLSDGDEDSDDAGSQSSPSTVTSSGKSLADRIASSTMSTVASFQPSFRFTAPVAPPYGSEGRFPAPYTQNGSQRTSNRGSVSPYSSASGPRDDSNSAARSTTGQSTPANIGRGGDRMEPMSHGHPGNMRGPNTGQTPQAPKKTGQAQGNGHAKPPPHHPGMPVYGRGRGGYGGPKPYPRQYGKPQPQGMGRPVQSHANGKPRRPGTKVVYKRNKNAKVGHSSGNHHQTEAQGRSGLQGQNAPQSQQQDASPAASAPAPAAPPVLSKTNGVQAEAQ